MKLSTLLTVFLILVFASLCFGQTAERSMKPVDVKVKAQAEKPALNKALAKYPNLQPVPKLFQDGLQCLLSKADQIKAAYTEAAGSGCDKMSTGEGTAYTCGTKAQYSVCEAAAQKLQVIFKNCKLKEPGTADFFGGTIATPGCNSLGIGCIPPIY